MALIVKELNDLCDLISIAIICPADSTLLLFQDPSSTDFWIPTIKAKLNAAWLSIDSIFQDLLGCSLNVEKLLSFSKVWIPNENLPYLHHSVVQAVLNLDLKRRSKSFQSKYKQRMRWVDEAELNTLAQSKCIKSPELIQIFQMAFGMNVTPLGLLTNYQQVGNFIEVTPDVIIITKYNVQEQLVHASGIDRHLQEVIYRDFILKCFPSIFMSLDKFTKLMLVHGWDKDEIPHLFRSADVQNRNALSFREFIYFLAAVEPGVTHAGALGELRCRYVFRYLDVGKKNCLKKEDLKKLFVGTRKAKNQVVDMAKIDKELSELYKQMKLSETHALSLAQFLTNVGELRIRGTSTIYRAPQNVRKYFIECLKNEAKQKQQQNLIEGVDNTDYSIAWHCLTLSRNEDQFLVDELTTFTYAISETTFKMQTGAPNVRQQSYDQFSAKCPANELIQCAKKLLELNKISTYNTKIETLKYNWGKIDSVTFFNLLREVIVKAKELFKKEPRLLEVPAPVYVLGDIHGNFADLLKFEKVLWPFGYGLCAGNLLFLGDLVDRGVFGVEVMAYLLSMKLLAPNKVFLVRGNHEVMATQKLWTFETECCKKFGDKYGATIFEQMNQCFDVLPLAAVVDESIFCCHGGIPPPWLCPTAIAINDIPVNLSNPQEQSSLAWELMWNDPVRLDAVSDNTLMEMMANEGFAVNSRRSTGHWFSVEALITFLDSNGFKYLVRAHECAASGFRIQQKGRMITIFSSSNYCGGKNEAACLLIDNQKLRVFRLASSD